MSQDYIVIAAGIVFLALIVIGLIRRIRKDGIGSVIPGHSGDRFDNILGAGFVNTIPMMPETSKKKYKIRKRKTKQ